MGSGHYDSLVYTAAVDDLHSKGATFARSARVSVSRDYDNGISDILNPLKLKNGMRESCYVPGSDDLLSIAFVLDLTGSMQKVPAILQKELPKIMDMIVKQDISDHPNLMFIGHDDLYAGVCRGGLQMSQFEITADKVLESLNEMVLIGQGGGNDGESYELAAYALAHHTKLESFEKNGEKGICIFVCDENPLYDNKDWTKYGTTPNAAKETFGDIIQAEIPMLATMKKVFEKYNIIVIRPGDTSCGSDHRVTKNWKKLLEAAGENPQNVIEVPSVNEVLSTAAMCIGRIRGVDETDLVSVLKAAGASHVDAAADATRDLVVAVNNKIAKTEASAPLVTSAHPVGGRKR